MDYELDLFVQAFSAKCRETIRPEIDLTVSQLKRAGHDVGVSSLEYSPADDQLSSEVGPSVTLAVTLKDVHRGPSETDASSLRFRGDVTRKRVEVVASTVGSATSGGIQGLTHTYELADLDLRIVKTVIAAWLEKLPGRA